MRVRRKAVHIIKRLLERLNVYESRKSYALDGLDVKLHSFLSFRNGFFIEAGANDGKRQSNTLYFERYLGWSGLLIEPIPELAEKCHVNRPNCIIENCALVSDEFLGNRIEIRYCDLMSVVKDSLGLEEESHVLRGCRASNVDDYVVEVPARTLNSLLRENSIDAVDLLSLDVEGYELKVLQGLDLAIYHPSYILVEVRPDNEHGISEYLAPLYHPLATLSEHPDRWDLLYKYRNG